MIDKHLETAIDIAFNKWRESAAEFGIPLGAITTAAFRIGFLSGYSHRQDIEIAQLDEKLERLK